MDEQSCSLTLEPSGEGNGCRSTTVIEVSLNWGFLHRAQAVESPKTPLPTIRMDEGASIGAEDAIVRCKNAISKINSSKKMRNAEDEVE